MFHNSDMVMHQSFVTTAPPPPLSTYGDGRGSDLFSSPAVPGMCRASDLMQIYSMKFIICCFHKSDDVHEITQFMCVCVFFDG